MDGRTHGRTDRRTDGRRTDFDTKLIYPFFLKKKAGITMKLQLWTEKIVEDKKEILILPRLSHVGYSLVLLELTHRVVVNVMVMSK